MGGEPDARSDDGCTAADCSGVAGAAGGDELAGRDVFCRIARSSSYSRTMSAGEEANDCSAIVATAAASGRSENSDCIKGARTSSIAAFVAASDSPRHCVRSALGGPATVEGRAHSDDCGPGATGSDCRAAATAAGAAGCPRRADAASVGSDCRAATAGAGVGDECEARSDACGPGATGSDCRAATAGAGGRDDRTLYGLGVGGRAGSHGGAGGGGRTRRRARPLMLLGVLAGGTRTRNHCKRLLRVRENVRTRSAKRANKRASQPACASK